MIKQTVAYVSKNSYAYVGCYQTVGNLPGLTANEQAWMVLGASLTELMEHRGARNVKIITSQEVADTYNGANKHISYKSETIHKLLLKQIRDKFATVVIEGVDVPFLHQQIENLKQTK